jgi:SagB-type dehydrogenase family enzyme
MAASTQTAGGKSRLPEPVARDAMTVAEALAARRSHSAFADAELSDRDLSQLCWAAQGMTNKRKKLRTTPSARSMFPLTVLLAHRDGIDEYFPGSHSLKRISDRDVRMDLQRVAENQSPVGGAPVVMVFAINMKRMRLEFGAWAERLCLLEAGAATENVLIEATANGIVGIPIGAFEPDEAARVLELGKRRRPVLLVPLGRPVLE